MTKCLQNIKVGQSTDGRHFGCRALLQRVDVDFFQRKSSLKLQITFDIRATSVTLSYDDIASVCDTPPTPSGQNNSGSNLAETVSTEPLENQDLESSSHSI